MNLISTDEAAEVKKTSRQVIIRAVKRGDIDCLEIGKRLAVKVNKKFENWKLSDRHKNAANTRWHSGDGTQKKGV